jgi:RimJ/RimL family protein N-acetyltransferase
MVVNHEVLFRQVITLRDGARVLLRPLVVEDKEALINLFTPIPFEERRYMRHNVNDPQIISTWVENINYEDIYPLVSVIGDRIVGDATLHFGQGPERHRAEVRIFLARDFRRRGLGGKMINALIEIAKRKSIYQLEIEIIRDLVNDIKAMQKVGFQSSCVFEDYYMLPDGELRDIVHMILKLRHVEDEF